MPTERRMLRLRQALEHRQPDLTVVFENIHDPHNVSAILRTCDAVGVHRAHLLYTIESFPKLGKRSSASARKWIELERHKDHGELRQSLKSQGFTIYATAIRPDAVSHFEVDWTAPSAIVLGNEHRGVSDEAIAIADRVVFIPMFGLIMSLNVSVAAAVILYEAARQRLQAGRYPNPGLTPQWIEEQLKKWTGK